jgi:hypothetical protein
MRKILLLLVLSTSFAMPALLWPQTSHAQLRQLPINGKRGVTGAQLPLPQVAIGRNTLQLAPGGLIFDAQNRTIVHASLPVGVNVWYQLNSAGQIQRMYILHPNEQTPVAPETK